MAKESNDFIPEENNLDVEQKDISTQDDLKDQTAKTDSLEKEKGKSKDKNKEKGFKLPVTSEQVNATKPRSNETFPTPDIRQEYKSAGFGTPKGGGGMYIYFNGAFSTISLSQSKYLNSLQEIRDVAKTKKLGIILQISNLHNIGKSDTYKYLKVSCKYDKRDSVLNDELTRVLIVQRIITTTDSGQKDNLIGILLTLNEYAEYQNYIYNPSSRSMNVGDEEEMDF